MHNARLQADGPSAVQITENVAHLDFPSGDRTLHLGMSVINLRHLEHAIHDVLGEFDMEKRAVAPIRSHPKLVR